MDEEIRVALVGRFQMGKSSCINGLLCSQMASVGNGWKSQTAECSEYPFANGVVLIDTPGFDDNPERDEMTEKAIRRADCVLFVVDNRRYPDEVCVAWMQKLKDGHKPSVLVCNCFDDVVDEDELPDDALVNFVDRNGFDMFMPVNGKVVLPINVSRDAPRNIDILREFVANIRLALRTQCLRQLANHLKSEMSWRKLTVQFTKAFIEATKLARRDCS